MIVTIDGPAAAGKTTTAKRLAKELGFVYVDTGALYRAVGLFMIRENIPVEEKEMVEAAVLDVDVSLTWKDDKQIVLLNGVDVTDMLRTEEVSHAASVTSSYPVVRERLLSIQRNTALRDSIVIEGRDSGSVLFPDADHKFFLTASLEVRAERRKKDYEAKGNTEPLDRIMKEMEERDSRDKNRKEAPLVCNSDMTYLDNSNMTVDEVISFMIEKIH